MKIREVIKLIEKDGWYLERVKGGGIGNTSIPLRRGWLQFQDT